VSSNSSQGAKHVAREVSAGYGELALVEMPANDLLTSLGWTFKNLYAETFGEMGSDGRESESEVILTRRLHAARVALNPGLPSNFRRDVPESHIGTKLPSCASLPCPP
jgi:type I restriction enzyme R subunit